MRTRVTKVAGDDAGCFEDREAVLRRDLLLNGNLERGRSYMALFPRVER
jgi:hypothetical protein